jgi:hypothetical protein
LGSNFVIFLAAKIIFFRQQDDSFGQQILLKWAANISRLNRIKKIDAHKNVTITTEKYLKLLWYPSLVTQRGKLMLTRGESQMS